MRMRRFAFGGNVTLSTSTHRHYDESVHRIKQLTRGNKTIGFNDNLSRIRNSTTTGSAVRVVYRGPFMSEDRSFDLSTAPFHVTMYRQYARKVGTSANSALIRYNLRRLKLSIALPSRKRGNERTHSPIINLKDTFFEPAVGSRPNFARMCG